MRTVNRSTNVDNSRPSACPPDESASSAEGASDPRLVTRGSVPPSQSQYVDTLLGFSGSLGSTVARFDWYAATVRINSALVLKQLGTELAVELREVAKGLNGYTNQVELRRAGDVIGKVLYGGNGGSPHVFASGEHAEELATVLRRLWPEHHGVSRCDVALDFDGPGTWDALEAFATRFSLEHQIGTNVYGDWITEGSPDGRTIYLGSRKSAVFLRIYEKGKQLRGLARDAGRDPSDISEDLVRVEIQVRPEKDARLIAAQMDPVAAFGFSRWSQTFASDLLGLDLDRVSIKHVRVSDDERALAFMTRQYGAVIERVVAEKFGGSWEAFGASLAPAVAALDRAEHVA